ncbi:MAG: sigma-E factor negative regulatory protein [Methylophilaceae bacterium]|uniref:sigma-E factor negative regulatory protein n=1 Tax=Methylovorus sp. MM2 TaxID=1848038 RepID=UPI0007E138F1|nr:sigma-E factor negative regulatory protein [Methylovorus sp. MM2]OAM52577.1 anti-sigma 24 factor [Methylovorus sp. MM2]
MKDQVSALIDGELSLENAEHLFIAINGQGEAAESWTTYHLIGDVMRGNPIFKSDFSERLMQRLDVEPTVLAPRAKKPAVKTSMFWSVAASVTAVMFVGWVALQQQANHGGDAPSVEIAQNVASEYVLAHQSFSPSGGAYYIQPASYSENGD